MFKIKVINKLYPLDYKNFQSYDPHFFSVLVFELLQTFRPVNKYFGFEAIPLKKLSALSLVI